jgi:enoyl-CoA hydratase/carnithine racemase
MPAASFQRHDQLGELVIDNPPMNRFSSELIADLRHAVDQAAGADLRAVVLRANGEVFSAAHRRQTYKRLLVQQYSGLMKSAWLFMR